MTLQFTPKKMLVELSAESEAALQQFFETEEVAPRGKFYALTEDEKWYAQNLLWKLGKEVAETYHASRRPAVKSTSPTAIVRRAVELGLAAALDERRAEFAGYLEQRNEQDALALDKLGPPPSAQRSRRRKSA